MSSSIDIRYGFLLFILLVLTSCRAKKTSVATADKKTVSDIISISTAYQTYKRYEAKSKIKYTSPQESFKGILNLRMRKDSAILIAVKKLGVEGARTLINQDSIIHIDRINHHYYTKGINKLNSYGIDLTYDYIQMLLSASTPVITEDNIIDSTYTDSHIIIKTMLNEILHTLHYDIYTGLLIEASFQDRFSITGHWSYRDYRLTDGYYYPFFRKYEIKNSAEESLILELDFSYIDINIIKPIEIRIPNSYNRIN